MSTIELGFITVVTIVIISLGVFLLCIGGSIATTEIIKNQKVCLDMT